MSANANSALFYLVSTLFELYVWVLLLRAILQWVRADFYNPFSQFVWRATQPLLGWTQTIVPRWRNLDIACLILTLIVAMIYITTITTIVAYRFTFGEVLWQSLLKLIVLTLNLYTFTLFIQAILSWVGPGVSNPAGSILWSINEPLLRPVRRLIPPLSGLDLSPLVAILVLQVLNRLVPLHGILR